MQMRSHQNATIIIVIALLWRGRRAVSNPLSPKKFLLTNYYYRNLIIIYKQQKHNFYNTMTKMRMRRHKNATTIVVIAAKWRGRWAVSKPLITPINAILW